MENKDDRSEPAATLRQRAEAVAREKALRVSEDIGSLSPE